MATDIAQKDKCERCGFVPKHMCQLDVDHIDGDGSNHDEDNIQTLCTRCHRIKTIEQVDHLTPCGVSNGGDGHLQVDMFDVH